MHAQHSHVRARRLGRPKPYLGGVGGALRAPFDAWLAEGITRHTASLAFREVRKGAQALSWLYVERRGEVDLAARSIEGRGKRAALVTYYAPLHFLAAHAALEAIGPSRFGAVARVVDLGCGSGATGAAAARVLGAGQVLALDRSGFALAEARRTYAAFGLLARVQRGRLPALVPRPDPRDLWVLGWLANELDGAARDALRERLLSALDAGVRLLVLEPLAGRAVPWWPAWRAALTPKGIEEAECKVRLVLPEWIARLDRATGLDHRVLGARVLAGPFAERAEAGASGPGVGSDASAGSERAR